MSLLCIFKDVYSLCVDKDVYSLFDFKSYVTCVTPATFSNFIKKNNLLIIKNKKGKHSYKDKSKET